jgi:hypothetical protein
VQLEVKLQSSNLFFQIALSHESFLFLLSDILQVSYKVKFLSEAVHMRRQEEGQHQSHAQPSSTGDSPKSKLHKRQIQSDLEVESGALLWKFHGFSRKMSFQLDFAPAPLSILLKVPLKSYENRKFPSNRIPSMIVGWDTLHKKQRA